MDFQSTTIGVSFAFFIVWMQRHGRWGYFFGAMAGDYNLSNTRKSGSSGAAPGSSAGQGQPGGVGGTPPTGTTTTTTTTTVPSGGARTSGSSVLPSGGPDPGVQTAFTNANDPNAQIGVQG